MSMSKPVLMHANVNYSDASSACVSAVDTVTQALHMAHCDPMIGRSRVTFLKPQASNAGDRCPSKT
ncbi:hypothetical protein SynA1825c_01752 [Synechococcus sp. A18-25c]|nr:hypothetical protein SynA1825c_01752 [Synechococcus sp. A18-25c]